MKRAWLVTVLVGGYVCWQLLADVGATKLVEIGSFVVPGGTFVYAVTFTWRDLVHGWLGRDWARACIVVAGALNVVLALYLWAVGLLATPAFYPWAGAWRGIFGVVPRVVVGSIVAEVVSQLLDTEVYQAWVARWGQRWRWLRVVVSNGVSVPVDSAVFAVVAFGGLVPVSGLVSLVWGQTVFKWAVGLLSVPVAGLVGFGDG
jgi:uncharacterized integral membrane protein (TIGR00697 family)